MNPLVHPTYETIQTMLNYPPPQHLKHKPIFMVPYEHFDGRYADHTDAKYLSIGLAQWRGDYEEEEKDAVSAKVWRYPDNKWSRMSEELPLHRVIDLCILLTTTLFQHGSGNITFPAQTFKNQNEAIELNMLEDIPEEFESEGEKENIKQRLKELYKALKAAGIGEET